MKGFDEPVKPYQVVGPLSGSQERLHLEESRQGFALNLEPGATDPAERDAIIEALRAAISSLL